MDDKQIRRAKFRALVRGAYDLQQLRIQTGARVVSNFKMKLGITPGTKEDEDLDKKAESLLKKIKKEYERITDGMVISTRTDYSFTDMELISDTEELYLAGQYFDLVKAEDFHFKLFKYSLRKFPIYTEYLSKIRGVGDKMAAVVLSEFDIEKCKYASSMWRYAGIDVAPDGKGRSRKKEHLIDVEYINKEGKKDTKKGITYNPFLKMKLMGTLADSFIMQGKNKYREIYDGYKRRLENHIDHKEKTPKHRHNMARRYMICRFVEDLYFAWKEIEGLPHYSLYREEKLGLPPHGKPFNISPVEYKEKLSVAI